MSDKMPEPRGRIDAETAYIARVMMTRYAQAWASGTPAKILLEMCDEIEAYIDPFIKDAKKARDAARVKELKAGRSWWRRMMCGVQR
jgi:hypothetical protein